MNDAAGDRTSTDLPAGTRERMLHLAIATIEEHGEAAVRVREVSDATGVSFASLYHFFGSREGLVEAALAEMYSRSLREVNAAVADMVNTSTTLAEFIEGGRRVSLLAYDPARASARSTRLRVLGGLAGRPKLAARLAVEQHAANLELASILGVAQQRGWLKPNLDLVTLAAWLTGLTFGRAIVEVAPEGIDLGAWNEMSIAALLAVCIDMTER